MLKLNQVQKASLTRVSLTAVCGALLCVPVMAQQDAPSPPPDQQQGQQQQGGGPGGQHGPRGAEMQQRMLEHMTKALNLSPDQVTQIKAIQADGQQKMMAMRNDNSVTGQDRRAKMMAMREDEQTKMKAVLTDDQKVKYEAMREKEMEHRQEHRGGNGDGPPPPPPSL